MFICIECGENYKVIFSPKKTVLTCKKCFKKMDRYFEVNNTLLLIDILLLRVEVFRHLIYNRNVHRVVFYYFLYFLSRFIFISRYFDSYNWLFPMLFVKLLVLLIADSIVVVFLVSFRNNLKMSLVLNTLILTSFYYLFVYFMILWEYKDLEYYLLIEFLVVLSNSIGISCITKHSIEEVFSFMVVLKIGGYLSFNYVMKN